MTLVEIVEFAGFLLLSGIFLMAAVVIILAMCEVASDADEKTEEWLKNNEKGRLDDEGKDKGSKRLPDATEEDRQDN